MIYNVEDGIYYATHLERLADEEIVKIDTSKCYEVDTGNVFIAYGGQWFPM